MKKFAVVLAGCGVFDGAEIHESVLSLLSIKKNGAAYDIFAPDIEQYHVVDHQNGKEIPATRNVMSEAARIARGPVKNLRDFDPSAYDALLLPGGFGVAKNLCTFAFDGAGCTVNPDLERAIKGMVALNKPVGALCISPVVLARVLGNINVTIGQDPSTAAAIETMGAHHVMSDHGMVVSDIPNKIFTTACYMLDSDIVQIARGTDNIVAEMMKHI